jgi:hypothetical protein
MGGACSRNEENRNSYRLLVGKPEGKRPLGRQRHRWVDDIMMDLLEIGWGGMDWIDLTQDRDKWWALVNTQLVASWVVLISASVLRNPPPPRCYRTTRIPRSEESSSKLLSRPRLLTCCLQCKYIDLVACCLSSCMTMIGSRSSSVWVTHLERNYNF